MVINILIRITIIAFLFASGVYADKYFSYETINNGEIYIERIAYNGFTESELRSQIFNIKIDSIYVDGNKVNSIESFTEYDNHEIDLYISKCDDISYKERILKLNELCKENSDKIRNDKCTNKKIQMNQWHYLYSMISMPFLVTLLTYFRFNSSSFWASILIYSFYEIVVLVMLTI